MCGAPECKGVVFGAEHELRAHAAREHGDAMSRAERRQAMTIPIMLQARRQLGSAAVSFALDCVWTAQRRDMESES